MNDLILTLNAGSSSLKFALFPVTSLTEPDFVGQVEKIGIAPELSGRWADGTETHMALTPDTETGHQAALAAALAEVERNRPGAHIVAVAHRIVHGGPERTTGATLTPEILEELQAYEPYAPLHQPNSIAGARAAHAVFPDALQVACFDTAFHRGHPWVNDTFAIPRKYYDAGVRRYGFHGLSYTFITQHLSETEPDLHLGRTVVAHLGNGASMCAMREGRSIASTMGFSAFDGLPMGTRSGQIDPGVLLYLMSEHDMGADEISSLLNKQSGLLGLSGVSSDMRTLEASEDPAAGEAIDYFVFRVQRELGGLTATLQGLDGLVFTGGIGEHSSYIRSRVCAGLGWLGCEIDAAKNEDNARTISTPNSQIKVLMIPTNEEAILAQEAFRQLSQRSV